VSIFKLQFPNKESFICLFKTKNVAGLKNGKKLQTTTRVKNFKKQEAG
jgi:hypothetical protein